MSGIDSLVVVVPVHDEQEVLGACLEAIDTAAARVRAREAAGPRVHVVVVLDACTDASAEITAAHAARGVRAVHCGARSVGAARALGVDAATSRQAPERWGRTWVATTDADSRVPASWLEDHLAAAEHGHDLLVGPVQPDPAGLDAPVLAAWHERHRGGRLHVHGANLGVRLSAYRTVGGFADLGTGEDVELVRALLEAGTPAVRQGRPVITSAREHGRAPDGFAGYLRALRIAVAEGATA